MKAMTIKEIRELLRDRRTLFLLFFVPTILLIIFGFAANFTIARTHVAILGPGAQDVSARLSQLSPASTEFSIDLTDSTASAERIEELLRAGQYDAVIYTDDTASGLISERAHMWIDGSAIFDADAVQKTWMKTVASDVQEHAKAARERAEALHAEAEAARAKIADLRSNLSDLREALGSLPAPPPAEALTPQALAALTKVLTQLTQPLTRLRELSAQVPQDASFPEPPSVDLSVLSLPSGEVSDPESSMTVLFNPDLETSWVLLPGLAGLILGFICVVIMSIGLVREREAGTLEQLAVMPLSPGAIIAGKITPYFAIAGFNLTLITILTTTFLDAPFHGSVGLYALAGFLFLGVVLGIGLLISSLSENTTQAVQLSLLTTIPQVLLSGLIFPLEAMATPIRWIGHILPLTWFSKAAQGIFLRGTSLQEIALPLGILCLMALIIFSSATLRMSRLLRNGGATSGTWHHLTVEENFHLVADSYRMDPTTTRQRIEELLEAADLLSSRKRLGGRLSGGMRQKLGVIMAMLPQPRLLLLDEPTTGVDIESRRTLWELITQAACEGSAVCLATTYLDEAHAADHIILLHKGRILSQGSLPDVLADTPGHVWEVLPRHSHPTARHAHEAAKGSFAWQCGTQHDLWTPDGPAPTSFSDVRPARLDLELTAIATLLANGERSSPPPEARVLPRHAEAKVLLEAEDISKSFGDNLVLDGVGLQVKSGQIVGLVGENGAGKSTLIRIIFGLIASDSGRVTLCGSDNPRPARRLIGYVPQTLGLYGTLTPGENFAFSARVFGHQPKVDEGFEDRPVRDLPLGVRMQVAVTCPMAHSPQLLILDEPTSGMDPLARAHLWQRLHALSAAGVGIPVTTHYQQEASQCHHLVEPRDGRAMSAAATMRPSA